MAQRSAWANMCKACVDASFTLCTGSFTCSSTCISELLCILLWLAGKLLPKLDFLTVVAVRDLSIIYSLAVEGAEEAVSPPVPAAVLQHDMQLLVAPDRPGLYLEMAQQLARWACAMCILLCAVFGCHVHFAWRFL